MNNKRRFIFDREASYGQVRQAWRLAWRLPCPLRRSRTSGFTVRISRTRRARRGGGCGERLFSFLFGGGLHPGRGGTHKKAEKKTGCFVFVVAREAHEEDLGYRGGVTSSHGVCRHLTFARLSVRTADSLSRYVCSPPRRCPEPGEAVRLLHEAGAGEFS